MSGLMGQAGGSHPSVGKREGEGRLGEGDMRGAGRKPEKGWKRRQGKEKRDGEEGSTARLPRGFLAVEKCFLHA